MTSKEASDNSSHAMKYLLCHVSQTVKYDAKFRWRIAVKSHDGLHSTYRQELHWRMPSSGMWRCVAFVNSEVSEKRSASITRVTIIAGLGTALAVLFLVHRFLSPWWWRRYVPPICRFLQEPHCVTSQKTAFFTVTAVKTWNLARITLFNNSVLWWIQRWLGMQHEWGTSNYAWRDDEKALQSYSYKGGYYYN
jgi:hypothetical protein